MTKLSTLAAAAATLALAGAAQPLLAQETFEPATLVVTSADGEEFEYTVGDASFYVSTSPGYEDVAPTVDFSLSLSSITPIDENLLEWSSQHTGKGKNAVRSITVVGSDGTEAGGQITYEISDAEVTSVSMSQSTYSAPSVSLSLMAGDLLINGIQMN
jgi:hypothetical protein